MVEPLIIERLRIADLTAAHWTAWQAMHIANPALYSPYFHPDYSRLIGRLQDDAYAALIKRGDSVIGFLPFQQRRRGGAARPIGAPMTDYHGIRYSTRRRYWGHDNAPSNEPIPNRAKYSPNLGLRRYEPYGF